MTIGIAAYGPEAGRAVLDGVLAAEVLGRGSIGGFVVFSAVDHQGVHQQLTCQSGGVSALDGITGLHDMRCAAAISSGPNRPEPLSQYLAGLDGVGLVTGHRRPDRKGVSGEPVNAATLGRIAWGVDPAAAVQAEVDRNPEADFGLIAVTADGRIGFGNTARVRRRGDLFEASRLEQGRGYALLGNSIHFNGDCEAGAAIGGMVWSRLSGEVGGCFLARLAGPVPVSRTLEDRIDLGEDGVVLRIGRAEPWWPACPEVTTVVYSRAPVWQGGQLLGACMTDVFARLGDGMAHPDPTHQCRFAVERM